MADRRRVVVTGMGLVTPVGIGTEKTWQALLNGRSGVGPITHFDPKDHVTKFAAEVKDFNPELWIDKKDCRRMDPFIHYAVAAAKMAVQHAGLEITAANTERIGVVVGSGIGGIGSLEETCRVASEKGPRRISPFFIPQLIGNLAPGQISMLLGIKGPNWCPVSACATGANAIGEAMRSIEYGTSDIVIAGGTEAAVTSIAIGGFNAMRAMSTRNDDPEHASRPFDRDRDGFVMGEGAGILVLEELEVAKKRGATILAELVGYGITSDAYHISAPAPGGEGQSRAMRAALANGNVNPDEIGYINAHATSTPVGDPEETAAVKTVFGDHARKLAVSATKSMTGHMLGAAGSVEAAITVLAIQHSVIPPTINLQNPDPACDLDYVPNTARERKVDVAMSNAFGFGGTNTSIIFRRFRA